MASNERIAKLEREYEAVTLIFGPKGKGVVQISSVPMKKLKALDEWHQAHHLPRKWRLSSDKNRLILE